MTKYNINLKKNQICSELPTGYRCTSDSGGPMVAQTESGNWILLGILAGENCRSEGRPMVFTEIASYVDWINSNM